MKVLVALLISLLVSLAVNFWQWRDRSTLRAENATLLEHVETVTAARAADNAAWAARRKKEQEVQEYAAEQYAKIDSLETAICDGLSDTELLNALRGLLNENPQCVRQAPASADGAAAGTGGAGRADKQH